MILSEAEMKKAEPRKLYERDMQKRFIMYNSSSFDVMIPNYTVPESSWEADIFCLRKSGFSMEVEIKLTVSDLRADFKKAEYIYPKTTEDYERWHAGDRPQRMKHEALQGGHLVPNYFAFMVSEEILEKAQEIIPDYCGIYYLTTRDVVRQIRPTKRLHSRKLKESHYPGITRNLQWRYMDLWLKK